MPWKAWACEGAGCKAPGPVKEDTIETRLSITLHGTCGEKLPEGAVVNP